MVTINEEFVNNEQQASEQEQQHPTVEEQPEQQDSDEQVEERPPTPTASPKKSPSFDETSQRPAPMESPRSSAAAVRAAAAAAAAAVRPAESHQPAAPQPAASDNVSSHVGSRRPSMGTATASLQKLLPQMEAVSRVLSIPVVESGVGLVAGVYSRVKNSNRVVNWGLGTAEGSVLTALDTSKTILTPLSKPFSGPLSVVDSLLCRGLDIVEYNVPLITLPPELMVSASRDYVSMRVLQPVLRMTATNAKLADALASRALDSADSYVDRFLPGDVATENGDTGCSSADKVNDTFHRVDRLSRKLQRRLTKRTLDEARAFRKHGIDILQTLLQFAELLVKDPKAFVEQCQQVWAHLSENEPENQVPPSTLEERLALLIREVARRVVHLTNYTASSCSPVASSALKSVQQEGARVLSFTRAQLETIHLNQILGDLTVYTHQLLERLAHLLAGLRSSTQAHGQHLLHAGTNNIAIVN